MINPSLFRGREGIAALPTVARNDRRMDSHFHGNDIWEYGNDIWEYGNDIWDKKGEEMCGSVRAVKQEVII
jgi:hypothetical protein